MRLQEKVSTIKSYMKKCLRQLPSFFFKHEHDNFCALEFIVFNFHNSIGKSMNSLYNSKRKLKF